MGPRKGQPAACPPTRPNSCTAAASSAASSKAKAASRPVGGTGCAASCGEGGKEQCAVGGCIGQGAAAQPGGAQGSQQSKGRGIGGERLRAPAHPEDDDAAAAKAVRQRAPAAACGGAGARGLRETPRGTPRRSTTTAKPPWLPHTSSAPKARSQSDRRTCSTRNQPATYSRRGSPRPRPARCWPACGARAWGRPRTPAGPAPGVIRGGGCRGRGGVWTECGPHAGQRGICPCWS
jgi:hypothetical protein